MLYLRNAVQNDIVKDYFKPIASVLRRGRGGRVLAAQNSFQLGHVGLQRSPPLVLPPVPWRNHRDPSNMNGNFEHAFME